MTALDDSVFVDKDVLNPQSQPDELVAHKTLEQQLLRLLNGIHDRYLPMSVSIYGHLALGGP